MIGPEEPKDIVEEQDARTDEELKQEEIRKEDLDQKVRALEKKKAEMVWLSSKYFRKNIN